MAEINGKIIAQGVLDRVLAETSHMHAKPVLAVVLVGEDPVSAKYVSKKAKAAEYAGVSMYIHRFPIHIEHKKLLAEVQRLQLTCDAMIVQLPLPRQIDAQEILDAVVPEKDADCLSSAALGMLARGNFKIMPPVAAAVREIFKSKKINLKGKKVTVVGQGQLVGRSVAAMMFNEPVTLVVCGEHTKNLADETKTADILITGVGKAGLIKAGMVKKGAIVIDAGTSIDKNGLIAGDVDYEAVAKKAKLITPVPGGVGPLTVALLLENVVTLFNLKNRSR